MKIEKGDTVRVNFNNSQFTLCSKAVVKYVPAATGDSWIFVDLEKETTHYVSEGCTVSLISKAT